MAAHGDEHAAFRYAMGLGPGDYRPRPHVIPAPSPAVATPTHLASSASSPQRESTNILVQIKLHSGETAQVSIAPEATNAALAIAIEVELGRQVMKLYAS